jgi:RHH-type proline utilization regulon transcriptional repressor/proline dehydrogenase/delta 1-pyrroline-5-carboxylate dehydrogenase
MGWFSRKTASSTQPPRSRPGLDDGAGSAGSPGHTNGSRGGSAERDVRPSPDVGESEIQQFGSRLLRLAREHKAGVLSSQFYREALMEWSMRDANFKVQMFRFVDAFPVLRTSEDIYDHLEDYLSQPGVSVPGVIAAALKAGRLAKGITASTIASQIRSMASRFIAGTDAASALQNLSVLWDHGIAFSVDLLGEACVSDVEADAYRDKYLDLVTNLPGAVAGWKAQPTLEADHLGPIPRTNVSVKISSLSPRCDPIDSEGAMADLMRRLLPILEAARDRGVFVNFDMEQFSLKDFTIELFKRCCQKVDFHAGLALQAYLRSGDEDARDLCRWAVQTGRLISVRLVKGAYWDYEVINAEQRGWPVPVWSSKRDTDACFERMAAIFLDACPRALPAGSPASTTHTLPGRGGVRLALGSHNVRSIAAAMVGLRKRGLPDSAIELQMLHGMADQLKHASAEMGLRVREYVPVGEMVPGMAYLVRRLLENTSNESWLKAGFMDDADPATLLASPHTDSPVSPPPTSPERHALSLAHPKVGDGRPFFNESGRDFSRAEVRSAFADAVRASVVPVVRNNTTIERARAMVAAAHEAFPAWRDTDPLTRCRVLVRAAEEMRRRRDELAGVMIREAGKTWREADADVCEAIDFCEYYARQAALLFEPRRIGRFIGELDQVFHQPRGVAVVISPWNFPLAICCGMTAAALVTGNTVIVKPAEQTPGIARMLHDILSAALRELGCPDGVLHFCPSPGETVGAALVRDQRVALIAFTGSRDVGLDILHAAAPPSPISGDRAAAQAWASGPHAWVKHVVCEMGGKNAIIVDTSADPDEAVLGVRASAFGFQGQKCSACSRCIVVDPEGPTGRSITHFRSRLIEATRALIIGDPVNPGTDIGPVIDADAAAKIRGFIDRARASGLSCESVPLPPGIESVTGRSYVAPHIFWPVPPDHELATEEVFGPVLAVMHARTFDEALRLANATPYKLTGGVFTRKPAHIERARQEFRVGNLYINRGITGALVARQPFGGFGMSGVGTKAGGDEYLLHFVVPRAVCENTMRRGFAPEL